MTVVEFNRIIHRRLGLAEKTLVAKGREYATADDRLYNFNAGAELTGKTPAQVLQGFALKHWLSLNDIVETLAVPGCLAGLDKVRTREQIDEKLGDALNYLLLLEAVLTEQLK